MIGPGAGGTEQNFNGTSAFGENIAIGSGSGAALTVSQENVFIGNLTATTAHAGSFRNVLVGHKAGNRLLNGFDNVFIGRKSAGAASINGANYNTFIGSGIVTGKHYGMNLHGL